MSYTSFWGGSVSLTTANSRDGTSATNSQATTPERRGARNISDSSPEKPTMVTCVHQDNERVVSKSRYLERYDEEKEHKEADDTDVKNSDNDFAEQCHHFDETSAERVLIQKAHQEKGDGESVVLHNEGATELFRSIEEVDWDRASDILTEHPEQASVWVVSTGTVNTTFNWSLWKRLPLHEAARRQAPTSFMTHLIRAHPASVRRVTQFGELPLHLAVECGASPAVINLLAVHHWMGCHTTDQSGRTPFDILQEAASLLDPMEHKAVHEALHSSVVTYQGITFDQATALAAIQTQHTAGLTAVRRQHDADLALEQAEQEKLVTQVTTLSQQMSQQAAVVQQQQIDNQHLTQDSRYWKDRVKQLQLENAKLKHAHQYETAIVQELRQTLATRDKEAVALADRIVDLQTAMTRLAHWHQDIVQTQLATVNKSFSIAMANLSEVTTTLTDHEEDLQTLLFDMGVEDDLIPTEEYGTNAVGGVANVTPDKSAAVDEDDQDVNVDDEEIDDEEMMRAVLRYTQPEVNTSLQ